MKKSILISILFLIFMMIYSLNAQTQFSYPMKPGDIQVYTFHSSNPKYVLPHFPIRSTTQAIYYDAVKNEDTIDDTVRIVKYGYLLDEQSGAESERINERGFITTFHYCHWKELYPTFMPSKDTIQLYEYDCNGIGPSTFDSTLCVIQRRFDTTIFGKTLHAFTMMSQKKYYPIQKTIADTFGLIYALRGDTPDYMTDTLRLNSAVINGVEYNRDLRHWNFLSLCDDNVYHYLYTLEDPPTTKKKIIRVSGDTIVQGLTYKKLGNLYPNFIRNASDGIHTLVGSGDKLYLPSNAQLGTIVDNYVVTDTGTVFIANKFRRRMTMRFSITDFYENPTWVEDIGIIKVSRWGYGGGYMNDTLMYAHICSNDFGTPLQVRQRITNPTSISLFQNVPNPFSQSTIINYKLPSASHVRLEVFDLLGRNITTLVDEEKDAGDYSSKFSVGHFAEVRGAKNDVHSGIYFYSLTVGNNNQIKKMIVLK